MMFVYVSECHGMPEAKARAQGGVQAHSQSQGA